MCIVQHPETDSELELEDDDAGLALQCPSSDLDTSEGESVSLKIALSPLFYNPPLTTHA